MRALFIASTAIFVGVALNLVTACGARSALAVPEIDDTSIHAGDAGDMGIDAGDAGMDAGNMVGLPPIDPICMGGGALTPMFPPFVPLIPPDVPASCANGFELGDATSGSVYTLEANNPAGAAAITLDVDFATYKQPDGVSITGVDATGDYALLDTCRLQTSDVGDQTGGESRPADQTIRQFRIDVKAGTTSLIFDFGGVVSPMYIQVLGLCDFNVTAFPDAVWWQAVP